MEKEIWKDVVGYEGLYMVNNYGEIYSLITNKVLSPSYTSDGYLQYNLRRGKESHTVFAHRAVAEAFIPNPNNLPLVNHKDENPKNAYVGNLEWCTHSYNNTYNNSHIKRAEYFKKIVFCYDENGELVQTYSSIREAAKLIGGRLT